MPLILTFLVGSILIAIIASIILLPVSEMLPKKNKQAQPSRRPFALLRLNQLLAVNKQLKLLKQRYLDTDQKIDVLNQQLITIQEAERKRLSAELHDEIGQHLTAIQFDLNTIKHSASLDEAKNSAAA
ncbi:histidine kinase, partial [Methylophaga sp. UBA4204]